MGPRFDDINECRYDCDIIVVIPPAGGIARYEYQSRESVSGAQVLDVDDAPAAMAIVVFVTLGREHGPPRRADETLAASEVEFH